MDKHLSAFILPAIVIALVHKIGSWSDLVLLLSWKLCLNSESVHQFRQANVDPAVVVSVARHAIPLITILQIARYIIGLSQTEPDEDDFPVKPLFFPCQTSHVRMFPKKHEFAYSYLFVGVPVGWQGNAGGMISVDDTAQRPWYLKFLSLKPGKAWWTVNSDHYLGRGHVEDGLRGKLNEYLESQGVDPEQYAYVYLLTAASFLDYSFNPLSIWHLYSAKKELLALVLEVNNTSDERHIYFLEPTATNLTSRNSKMSDSVRYTTSWNKDFYVSTFNARAGKYSVAAYDPLFPFMTKTGPVNTTITLSTESRAMLIARVYSVSSAVDPTAISVWEKTRFLASWWWVGYATFSPRTLHQAWKLFRLGVPWVSRPEPRKDTTPRHADAREVIIEKHFRQYLKRVVESSESLIGVTYHSAGLVGNSASAENFGATERGVAILDIRVLTPLFYTRIVQYKDIHIALMKEVQSQTISISDVKLLATLDWELPKWPELSTVSAAGLSLALINVLRGDVEPIPRLEKEEFEEVEEVLAYSSKVTSSLDQHVAINAYTKEALLYSKAVLKILCAERFALGFVEILDFEIMLIRIFVAWVLAVFVVA